MTQHKLVTVLFLVSFLCGACSSNNNEDQPEARGRTDERVERNPLKKGRYQCWRLSSAGDEVASDLFILSDKMYQVDDATGSYTYRTEDSTIQWTNGPFNHATEKWIGYYTPKGTPTVAGGQTLETMIEIRKQSDLDAGNKRVIMQCNCAEKE